MATKSLGELEVKIGADTTGLVNAGQQVGRVTRKAANDLGKWAAGAAAVGAAMFSMAASSIDALAKISDKLGIATEELQKLRFAAEQTGVASGVLDTALQRMVRRVAEAAEGTGEAKNALIELGLSAKDLANLSPDEQFSRIADAMQNTATQGDRVRLAMRLFDTEGVALVNTLALGSEGLEEMGKRAEALGMTFSRFDASQIEKFNDSFAELRGFITGIVQRFAIQLAPILTAVVDKLVELAVESDNFGDAITNAIDWGVKAVGVMANGLRGLEIIYKGLQIGLKGLAAGAMIVAAEIAGFFERVTNSAKMAINEVIDIVNKLPMMDPLEKIQIGKDSLSENIRGASDLIFEEVAGLEKELLELALAPIPSEVMEKFVASKRAQIEVERAAALEVTAIQDVEGKRRVQNEETNLKGREEAQRNFWNNTTSLMNSKSRALFEVGKAAAITNVIIAGVEEVSEAFKWGTKIGGPWTGAAFGAAAALGVATRVQQIQSTKFGSTGGATSVGSGGTPVVNTESQVTQAATIQLIGSDSATFSRDQVEDLISGINDAVGDGVELRTT